MTTTWHIAQLNVGTMLYAHDDERMSGFFSQLDDINALADQSPGFVWRLQSDSGNATDIQVDDDPLFLVNMSVWESVEALRDYVYKTEHVDFLRRRREWFEAADGPYLVLFWVPAGHRPTPEEAMSRLEQLRADGPSPEAFTFREQFAPPVDAT